MKTPITKPVMKDWVAKCDICGTRPCVRIWNTADQEVGHVRTLCGAHLREIVPLIAAGLELPVVH